VQWTSLRERHGEVRYVAVGLLEGVEFTCVFTMRVESRGSYPRGDRDMRKGTVSGKSGGSKYVRLTMTPEQMRKASRSIDWKRVRAMTDEEIERNALDDPDSIVPFDEATEPQLVPPMPDVALLRRRLKLSQAEFATRFGFSVATVRNWEQGRVLADGPARILLAVIANEPQAVIRALRPAVRVARSKPKKKAA
jgi:putative transcriptional regulator